MMNDTEFAQWVVRDILKWLGVSVLIYAVLLAAYWFLV